MSWRYTAILICSLFFAAQYPKVYSKTPHLIQVRPFYEKRMGQEVDADTLGDEFKVIILNLNKSGFSFVQSILWSIQ